MLPLIPGYCSLQNVTLSVGNAKILSQNLEMGIVPRACGTYSQGKQQKYPSPCIELIIIIECPNDTLRSNDPIKKLQILVDNNNNNNYAGLVPCELCVSLDSSTTTPDDMCLNISPKVTSLYIYLSFVILINMYDSYYSTESSLSFQKYINSRKYFIPYCYSVLSSSTPLIMILLIYYQCAGATLSTLSAGCFKSSQLDSIRQCQASKFDLTVVYLPCFKTIDLSNQTTNDISIFVSSYLPILAQCPNRCSQFGTCNNGVCSCYPGHYGKDCSSTGTHFFHILLI